ncbi:hypothetical protein [Caldisalinibacter kiritimatiensis]|nr:hypothetical protein [Caldisalinibacter kiritimatiensis]
MMIFVITVPSFAISEKGDSDYIKYKNALENVEKSNISEEEKTIMKKLINEKYQYIVAKKNGKDSEMPKEEFTMIQSTSSSNPFECIATYTKSVDDIKHDANTLMALGTLSSGIGFFAKKVPLIGWGVSATGAFFQIAGATVWLSVSDLEDDAVYTGENWFRWTDETNYEYEVYTKTYVTYDGELISEVEKSGIQQGDWNE